MASRGYARYKSNWRQHGPSRGSFASTRGGRSASPDVVELPPPGDLVVRFNATDLTSSDGPAEISNPQYIASYNWLDSSEPIILVPGSPPVWSPPIHRRKLEQDKGTVFIDQNAARFSAFPLEPMFRAVYEMRHDRKIGDVDVVICRNTMSKLFDFVSINSKTFEMDVEIIGGKALFVRKEKKNTEVITEFRGFGYSFPDEYTRWDSAVKGSSSHHRLLKYDFAGLTYLLRFESSGCLEGDGGGAEIASSLQHKGQREGSTADQTLLEPSDLSLTIGEKLPLANRDGLLVRNAGREVDQGAMIEIKTRAVHKVLDMEAVLPRLWMSQTSNLVAAYHKGGRFDDVQLLQLGQDIDDWEERNYANLQKLNGLVRRIIDTVKNTTSMKCRVRVTPSGELEIWELDISYPCALPDDLCDKLMKEDLEEEDNAGLREQGDYPESDNDHYYSSDNHDSDYD